jgi:hypothetical protein
MDKLQTPGSVINIGINRGARNVMMGGNLGLPTYQVALGFSGEPPEDRRFADMMAKQLGARWQTETVPAGKGAFPMKSGPHRSIAKRLISFTSGPPALQIPPAVNRKNPGSSRRSVDVGA